MALDQLAPLYPSPLYFNGDDAIALSKNGLIIDIIEKIGEDPVLVGLMIQLMVLLISTAETI